MDPEREELYVVKEPYVTRTSSTSPSMRKIKIVLKKPDALGAAVTRRSLSKSLT